MKLNNRGMTLIEMVVAFAILGVLSVAVFSMMLTSTKTYTKMTSSIKLQYETQVALANIESRISNCNRGITWKVENGREELFLVSGEDNARSLEVIYLSGNQDKLYYGTASFESTDMTFYLLAEHVASISVELLPTETVDGITKPAKEIKQVKLTLTMEQNGVSYTGQKTIALRNRPSGEYDWTLTVGTQTNNTITLLRDPE